MLNEVWIVSNYQQVSQLGGTLLFFRHIFTRFLSFILIYANADTIFLFRTVVWIGCEAIERNGENLMKIVF
jgi:hypothetical protein